MVTAVKTGNKRLRLGCMNPASWLHLTAGPISRNLSIAFSRMSVRISNLLVPGQLAEASRVILVLNVHLPVLVRGFGDDLGNDVGVPVLAGNVLRQELDLEVGFSKNEPVSYDFMS